MATSIQWPISKTRNSGKQKKDRYEMHKYWGKKPSNDLSALISEYSKEGDTLLDPFSGYGVFCCEAYIQKRNVISNDLNPIANFIQHQLFRKDVDFIKLEDAFNIIVKKLTPFVENWYKVGSPDEKQTAITVLRNSNNEIIKCKYHNGTTAKLKEYVFSSQEISQFRAFEENYSVDTWYPKNELIENSRISAKKGMKIPDLFTTRTLACNSMLFKLIMENSNGPERDLLLLAFTSNIANCSKLVPPIRSRGDMAPGAWMTGFYWGETYLENNVLHYFKNRYKKIVNGKLEYLSCFETLFHADDFTDIQKVSSISQFNEKTYGYYIKNDDTRKLNLESESIDYIFTDPPYGDSVPYFEQSALWNSWLKFAADYENEIIISNSPIRTKDVNTYCSDMEKAIPEIYRVLKKQKFFSITFHSLSGSEWNGITNSCIKAGFELHNFEWLTQKTFTPRQLNRAKTVKGDVLITLKKPIISRETTQLNEQDTNKYFLQLFNKLVMNGITDTNSIFMEVIKDIFKNHVLVADIDFYSILSNNFEFIDNNWKVSNAK